MRAVGRGGILLIGWAASVVALKPEAAGGIIKPFAGSRLQDWASRSHNALVEIFRKDENKLEPANRSAMLRSGAAPQQHNFLGSPAKLMSAPLPPTVAPPTMPPANDEVKHFRGHRLQFDKAPTRRHTWRDDQELELKRLDALSTSTEEDEEEGVEESQDGKTPPTASAHVARHMRSSAAAAFIESVSSAAETSSADADDAAAANNDASHGTAQ